MKNLFLFYLLFVTICFAEDKFVSTRSNEVNVRTGPNEEYPIKFVYQLKHVPLLVLGEYENWYKIKDKDGEEGWLNKNLTTSKRHLIVVGEGEQTIYKSDNFKKPIAKAEENVILEFVKCNFKWCKIKVKNITGWIEVEKVWGI
ncbi:MAG: SH3 domain-containing protein [Rickettsiales bacterium]|jgi:SH3-like domain-containing protein|nr:SH3 domain-containing protein [Rickettsiales bacterium]